jgi:hypothetical protein
MQSVSDTICDCCSQWAVCMTVLFLLVSAIADRVFAPRAAALIMTTHRVVQSQLAYLSDWDSIQGYNPSWHRCGATRVRRSERAFCACERMRRSNLLVPLVLWIWIWIMWLAGTLSLLAHALVHRAPRRRRLTPTDWPLCAQNRVLFTYEWANLTFKEKIGFFVTSGLYALGKPLWQRLLWP